MLVASMEASMDDKQLKKDIAKVLMDWRTGRHEENFTRPVNKLFELYIKYRGKCATGTCENNTSYCWKCQELWQS